MAPEAVSANCHLFDSYWKQQANILTDRCRILGMPTLFLTIAPAEWKFPLHSALFSRFEQAGRLSEVQGMITLHLYHVLHTLLKDIFDDDTLFPKVHDYSSRVEFQGRGTLHVHI